MTNKLKMIFKWTILIVKILMGFIILIGLASYVMNNSKLDYPIDNGPAIFALLMMAWYGFTLISNSLGEMGKVLLRKIFLKIETVLGFLFSLFSVSAAISGSFGIVGKLIVFSIAVVMFLLSIRDILIIKTLPKSNSPAK